MKSVLIHFDGLCEPTNPGGDGCYGFVIHADGEYVAQGNGHLGRRMDDGAPMTNNVAEYAALIYGLRKARDCGCLHDECSVECRGDSQLVVEQVSGNWRINKPHLQRAATTAVELLGDARKWSMRWIPREENERADELSRNAYRHATGKEPPIRGGESRSMTPYSLPRTRPAGEPTA